MLAPDCRSSSSEKKPFGSPIACSPALEAPVMSTGSSPTAEHEMGGKSSSLIASRNGSGEGLNFSNLSGVIIELKK